MAQTNGGPASNNSLGKAGGGTVAAAAVSNRSRPWRDWNPCPKRRASSSKMEFSAASTATFVAMAFVGRRFPREPRRMSLRCSLKVIFYISLQFFVVLFYRLAFATVSLAGFTVISLYR